MYARERENHSLNLRPVSGTPSMRCLRLIRKTLSSPLLCTETRPNPITQGRQQPFPCGLQQLMQKQHIHSKFTAENNPTAWSQNKGYSYRQ